MTHSAPGGPLQNPAASDGVARMQISPRQRALATSGRFFSGRTRTPRNKGPEGCAREALKRNARAIVPRRAGGRGGNRTQRQWAIFGGAESARDARANWFRRRKRPFRAGLARGAQGRPGQPFKRRSGPLCRTPAGGFDEITEFEPWGGRSEGVSVADLD